MPSLKKKNKGRLEIRTCYKAQIESKNCIFKQEFRDLKKSGWIGLKAVVMIKTYVKKKAKNITIPTIDIVVY